MSDVEQLQIFNPCSNSCGWPLWVQLVHLGETNRSLSDESLAAFLQEKKTVCSRLYTVVTHVDIPGNLACASLLYWLNDTAQWHSNLWQVSVKKTAPVFVEICARVESKAADWFPVVSDPVNRSGRVEIRPAHRRARKHHPTSFTTFVRLKLMYL